jgi:hypothetical protein
LRLARKTSSAGSRTVVRSLICHDIRPMRLYVNVGKKRIAYPIPIRVQERLLAALATLGHMMRRRGDNSTHEASHPLPTGASVPIGHYALDFTILIRYDIGHRSYPCPTVI